MTPNLANIQKWVDALRSGEFVQLRRAIRNNDGHMCCLGVVCEVFKRETGRGEWQPGLETNFRFSCGNDWSGGTLIQSVAEWLGLDGVNPKIGQHTAIFWNDNEEASFTKIADLIEQEWLKPKGVA